MVCSDLVSEIYLDARSKLLFVLEEAETIIVYSIHQPSPSEKAEIFVSERNTAG